MCIRLVLKEKGMLQKGRKRLCLLPAAMFAS